MWLNLAVKCKNFQFFNLYSYKKLTVNLFLDWKKKESKL